MRIHIYGNCQAAVVAEQMRMLLPEAEISSEKISPSLAPLPACDVVFVQKPYAEQLRDHLAPANCCHYWPSVVFGGFHPDIVTLAGVPSPTGGWHSSLALKAGCG